MKKKGLWNKYKVQLSLSDRNDVRVIAYGYIDGKTNVLDVGCACGDFGSLMSSKGCRVQGIDYNSQSIRYADLAGQYERLYCLDLNNIDTDAYPELHGYFEYITFLDVLEHLIDPYEALARILRFMRPDGYAVISLPNISFGDLKLSLLCDDFTYTDTGILDSTHLRFFTHKPIASLLSDAGLVIIDVEMKVSELDQRLLAKYEDQPLLLNYISGNPHSYIYQYVVKAQFSRSPLHDLAQINRLMLSSVDLNQIKRRVKYYYNNKLVMLRSKMVRKAKTLLKFISYLFNRCA